ncbi:MAG: hypothetical protein NTV34_19380, partial [Proteobacteria bacterium]|nr:hypothetical protein [Pseudomonadota bacterium]
EPKKEELAKLKQMQSALKTYLIAESKLSQESVESHPDYEQVVFVAVNILFQNQEKKMAVLRNEALRELRKKEHEEFLNERRNSCQEDYKACADLCEFKRRKAEKEECLWQCNYDRIPCLAKWSS